MSWIWERERAGTDRGQMAAQGEMVEGEDFGHGRDVSTSANRPLGFDPPHAW